MVMDPLLGCEGLEFDVFDPLSPLELGFSAQEGVDALVGVYETEIEWIPASGPVTYVPGESIVGLRLELLRPNEVEEGLFFVQGLDCAPGSTCAVSCLSQLQFDTSIRFRSEDRVLDEEWVLRIGTWKTGKSFARVDVDPSGLAGSLSAADFQNGASWRVAGYQVELETRNGAASGRFQVFAEEVNGAGIELGTLAVWPPLPRG